MRERTRRLIPGLFEHMNRNIPECVGLGDQNDISLNCCITAWNYQDLPDVVRLAERWGCTVNFSAYSLLRMDEPQGLVKHNGSAEGLKRSIEQVIELKREGKPVYTSERVLWKFYDFLVSGYAGGCQAGYRFVVVNPDGRLTPCAMVMAYFNRVEDMQKEFSCKNTCGACYISTRAASEKTVRELIGDNLGVLRKKVSGRPLPIAVRA